MSRAAWLITPVFDSHIVLRPPGRVSHAAQEPQSTGRFVTSPWDVELVRHPKCCWEQLSPGGS